jgi:hypothetical protein
MLDDGGAGSGGGRLDPPATMPSVGTIAPLAQRGERRIGVDKASRIRRLPLANARLARAGTFLELAKIQIADLTADDVSADCLAALHRFDHPLGSDAQLPSSAVR